MKKITIYNDFHSTEATLHVKDDNFISASQVKRAKNKLCGISGCTCSDDIGQRGPQEHDIAFHLDGQTGQVYGELIS